MENVNNKQMKLNIKKIGECHALPKQAHSDDVGYDVVADEVEFVFINGVSIKYTNDMTAREIVNNSNALLYQGELNYIAYKSNFIAWLNNPEYHLEAVANSRITKSPLYMKNGVGIIDPSYRGQIEWRYGLNGGIIDSLHDIMGVGDVCGQLVIRKTYHAEVTEVEEVDETERGSGGFGSTANK